MLGGILIGLSGMQAYSSGLRTISNNVANMDTLGYKSSTVSFSDLFSENSNGLAYSSWQSNGSNGNGVRYNAETINFTQGTLQQTGGALDLSIQGAGFLVVQNETGETYYTRTGQFSIDSKGYISNQNGDRLTILNTENKPEVLNINDHLTNIPSATKTITFSQNISSSESTYTVSNIKVYDKNGGTHIWSASLDKVISTDPVSTTVQWGVTLKDESGASIGTGSIYFQNGQSVAGANSVTINVTPSGSTEMPITLDFQNVLAYSGTTSLQASKVDGHPIGSLTGATINSQGKLVLNYSNSQTEEIGSIALAEFQDTQALIRVGGSLFKNTGLSEFRYNSSGAHGVGTLLSGQVEASNVDLTAEFGRLILVQRGFDASSQVISISNDMIQQLFGMRGHG